MGQQPTYDDAKLILRLYDLRREETMRKARSWFAASFKVQSLEEVQTLCPPGSQENAYMRMVATYWEMVASFVTSGVLDQELFFQSGAELLFCWERVRPILGEYRKMMKHPAFLANLEQVGNAYAEWFNRKGPEAYAAFQARVRG